MSFPTDHPKNSICCGFVEPNNKKYFFYPSAETIKGKVIIQKKKKRKISFPSVVFMILDALLVYF